MYSYGPPHIAVQKQDDQHEHTFSNYVRIRDVVQKTCLRRWTIGKSGERGSGISVLPAQHDDDDDDDFSQVPCSHVAGEELAIPSTRLFSVPAAILKYYIWLACSTTEPNNQITAWSVSDGSSPINHNSGFFPWSFELMSYQINSFKLRYLHYFTK